MRFSSVPAWLGFQSAKEQPIGKSGPEKLDEQLFKIRAWMMYQVTEQWLEKLCSGRPEEIPDPKAYGVAVQMGPLASWWLRDEVLQKARTYAFQANGQTDETRKQFASWEPVRRAPEESGCCWLLLVNRRPADLGLLRPAFVLPVRWVKDQPHHPRLPKGLHQLADQVLVQLRQEKEIDAKSQWGLRPAWENWLSEHDLSGLEWGWESAWAALAAGLLLAYWEGRPDPTVWATGAYQPERGIYPVEDVGPKALAAWQMGAKVLFVPRGQDEEVRQFLTQQALGNELEVLCFEGRPPELRKCLEKYLARLEVPPGADAPPDRRKHYFLRIPDDGKARLYYAKYILPEIRAVWAQNLNLTSYGIDHLVTIVSKGFDLTALAVGVFEPKRCLLLFDSEMAEEANQLPARLQEMGLTCQFEYFQVTEINRWTLLEEFRKAIHGFMNSLPPERLLVDLTPGLRVMNLALYDATPEGSFIVHCQAEMDRRTRRPIPFTEQFTLWQILGERKWKAIPEIGR